MKYLVSVPVERDSDGRGTTAREPVVPCLPSQHSGAFLAVPSFRLAHRAEVAETDADPDEMCRKLEAEYPGLPRSLHENYIMKTFEAVQGLPAGTVCTVSVNQKQAMLVPDGMPTLILWNEQPL